MARIRSWLKQRLLPAWNGGHRLASRLAEYGDAIVQRRIERCTVCGRVGPMLYRPKVIPSRLVDLWGLSPRAAEAFARKESCACSYCGAKLRARRLAQVLLETYPIGSPPFPSASLATWCTQPEARSLRIVEINWIEGLHEALQRLPHFHASDFQPGASPGAEIEGVRSEDLTRLTYEDQSFDLVLTSETLEHVPDLNVALTEIHRVLAPGGRHVFTIPLLPDVAQTFPRARLDAEGVLHHLAPPLYHPAGDAGYLVFTEFGSDLPELLERAGFDVAVHFGPTTEDDLAQVYVGRKRQHTDGA